jgi:integrase
MVERAGREAKLAFKAHPHMLRHACGYALANKGHDTRALQAYLGHRNIQHTVRYTELTPTRFKDFWRDENARRGHLADSRCAATICPLLDKSGQNSILARNGLSAYAE